MGGLIAVLARTASAGPWNIEPRLGVSADYSTNPELREVAPMSEEHVAALFNLPLRYDADAVEFSLTPSGRISNSRGYSSLASNYAHVDANAQFINDLGATSVQADLARDSSLAYAGGLTNGIGVRRDTMMTAADWTRSLTQRTQLQLDLSWTKVRYDQSSTLTYLVDYRYLSAGPTFDFDLDERDTLKLLGSYGQYQSLDGITESKSENLQLGWVRQLNQLWSLSASGGYSKSRNSEKFFFGPFYLGSLASDQNATTFAATLSRQSEKLKFSGGYTRALQPTGYAYLSRQDTVSINENYLYSERWDFVLGFGWQKILNPIYMGGVTDVRYLNAQLTANWHFTPQWIVSMHATRIAQQYGKPPVSGASSGVSVDIVRQFLRTEL